MKRIVQALLLVGAVLVAPLSALTTPVQAASVPYGETILSQGAHGAQVVALQTDLQKLGYFTYPQITGYYGPITAAAVKRFQHDHHLTENSMVGMTTGPLIQRAVVGKQTATALEHPATSVQPQQKFGVFQYDKLLSVFDTQAAAVTEGQKWDHCSVRAMSSGTWVWSDYPTHSPSQIIHTAMQFIGTPYVWGGAQPGGFDCSGFVDYVFGKNDVQLPRTAHQMYAASGTAVNSPQAGDLVFFSTISAGASHVGIYIGGGQFISATTHGVKVSNMYDSYWGPRYLGARHVL